MKTFKQYLLSEGTIKVPQRLFNKICHELAGILVYKMNQSEDFSKEMIDEFIKHFNVSKSDLIKLKHIEKNKQIIIKYTLSDIPQEYRKLFSASKPYVLKVDFILDSEIKDILAFYYDQSMQDQKENRIEFYIEAFLNSYLEHPGVSNVFETESIILHELTHFIQFRCFGQFPDQISQSDSGQNDLYSITSLERDPYIKSEIGMFLKVQLKDNITPEFILQHFNYYFDHYINHREHFQELKKQDSKKYSSDIKKFYNELKNKLIEISKKKNYK